MLKGKNTEGGFAHLMLIVAVVVIAAIGGIGYVVMSKQKAKDSGTTATSQSAVSDKVVADACNKHLNDKDFCKFASYWKGLDNYKSTLTSTSAEGTSTIYLESESSDKSSMSTKLDGKETSAFITIGKTFYTKDLADGSWTSYTNDTKATEIVDVKEDIKINDFSSDTTADSNIKYKKIGKEACGKLTCFKYHITDSADTKTEQFIWFDTKDFQLRRWLSKSAEGSTDMTISYDKVKITAPSPVKTSSTSTGDAAAMQAELDAAMKEYQNSIE